VRALLTLAAAAAAIAAGSCGGGQRPTTPSQPIVAAPATPAPTPTPTPTPEPTPEPTPDPSATPDACPPLTRWSSGIHNITGPGNTVAQWPLVGGHVVIDSTPLFNGRPCNDEHDHCGGRKCEDPRGGEWTLLVGTSPSQPRGEGYQFRIGPLQAGDHRWRVCPLRDAMDPSGQPLMTGQHACTEGIFTVLESPPPQ
jgi:hypothetical protein